MTRFIRLEFFVLLFAFPTFTFAVTLDEIFLNFQKCEFKEFYYAPWETNKPVHPYFSERNLNPYKEQDGLYYFKVKDKLFGLPVSELIVPGTWAYHVVIFDVPLAKARAVLKRKFGATFAPSKKSEEGFSPALDKTSVPNTSALYCKEIEGGM